LGLALGCSPQPEPKDGGLLGLLRPSEAEKDEFTRYLVPVRAQVAAFIAKDEEAPAKMLAFFLGGEDEILGGPWGNHTRPYVEEWVYRELTLLDHNDDDWDRILARNTWRWSWSNVSGGLGVRLSEVSLDDLHPEALDRKWNRKRLMRAIQVLVSSEGADCATVIRELRIFGSLNRIPEDLQDSIDKAMVTAAERVLQTKDEALKLALLRWMADPRPFPDTLNELVWSAARDPSPGLRAQALLTGILYTGSKEQQEQAAKRWTAHALAALQDADPEVRQAALIALSKDTSLGDAVQETLASQAIGWLKAAKSHEDDPQLLVSCLELLSTQSYGPDNPQADQWSKIVAPLLESRETAVRSALPELALHRFPATQAAKSTISALTRDRRWTVRVAAWEQIEAVDLVPKDLEWLEEFREEKAPLIRIFITVAMRSAAGDDFNEATSALIRRWASENLDPNDEKQKNRLSFYLQMICQSRIAYLPWRPLLEQALGSPLERNRMLAWICLAARGWLSPVEARTLEDSLPDAKGEERQGILIALYLMAHRNGQPKTASTYLDQLMVGENPDLYYVAPFALEAGGLTENQQQILARGFMSDIRINPMRLSERRRKLWATLGSAWKPYIEELEGLEDWAE